MKSAGTPCDLICQFLISLLNKILFKGVNSVCHVLRSYVLVCFERMLEYCFLISDLSAVFNLSTAIFSLNQSVVCNI